MQRNSNYITILKESLKKKITILDRISEQNQIQADIAKEKEFDYDVFQKTLDEKEVCIKELNALDAGFQSVYDRMKDFFAENKALYASEIKELQGLITIITEKSMNIMAEENRNKEAIMNRKVSMKKEISMARNTNKVAANYHRTMTKLSVMDSQFIDMKK